MKKLSYLLAFLILGSCTSNTIFEKPTDLIPKDTMSLLVQEMMIASSATYIKNKNMERNINYMPLVYERFQIDSVRFQTSNLYYMSKVDEYKLIFEDAKNSLKEQKAYFDNIKSTKDSLRLDSIKRNKDLKKNIDSVSKALKLKDSIPRKIKN
ncbi:DUF4296 domain-containing protein [Polaribacter dokdonensis]|uniref:DUF4296 domain-containing protein n=1 Tax=Polaribacter dokdonensis DSW-5 TaxID=1300348 RepID=A0A0N0CFE9_9FLAO|nr:DUF4296 domain-containing protein [Polaribacter dokdonensis]KOY51747.1 hypothetical protein I602_1307 [Polaribacter dokdonensis DSW-5]SEE04070.1 protein of unknown function [Polaribacter dokdonensis DSW-5]